ncbi:MAG: XdhC family protein [Pirellulales bacterium]
MRELLRQLKSALDDARPMAYCRLVETRGSTPQKAGATMLIFADGSQAGTLGGGCVEAEVRRRALEIMEQGQPQVASFQLDSDYGWDDGLICGGRMQVLIDPLPAGSDVQYYRTLIDRADRGQGAAEVIVFDGEKCGLQAPACYLFDEQGELLANCRGELTQGHLPAAVAASLQPLHDRPRPSAAHGIAFLPNLPRCRLLIVGGGHIGQAVGNMAPDLGFDVWVVDDRETYVSRERFPQAEQLICGDIAQSLKEMEITPSTYCLIVTRGHNHDEEALFHLAERGARYVGMIGSQRKIKLIFDDLLNEGISAEALAKVYAPLGIDIGSQTVPEIAISILAELIAHRNLGGQVPGRPDAIVLGA